MRSGLSLSTLNLKRSQEEYRKAIPLFERALSIRTKKLGANHPHTVGTQNSLEIVRKKVRAQSGGRSRQSVMHNPSREGLVALCTENSKFFVPYLRREDEAEAACDRGTVQAMSKTGAKLPCASGVTCNGTSLMLLHVDTNVLF